MQVQTETEFSSLGDAELFHCCERGDEGAWEYLYGFVLSVTHWKRWNLGDNAEDIAQSVILSLIEKGIKMVKDQGNFRAFVKRVTVNRILDSYKTKTAVKLPDDSDVGIDVKASGGKDYSGNNVSEKRLLNEEIVELSLKIIKRLPQYCRELMKVYLDY